MAGTAAASGKIKRKLVRKCILDEGGKRAKGTRRAMLGKDIRSRQYQESFQLLRERSETKVREIGDGDLKLVIVVLETVMVNASRLDNLVVPCLGGLVAWWLIDVCMDTAAARIVFEWHVDHCGFWKDIRFRKTLHCLETINIEPMKPSLLRSLGVFRVLGVRLPLPCCIDGL